MDPYLFVKSTRSFKFAEIQRRTQQGFTLVELLVVIGIIALLISILLPSLGKARQAAQRAACATKLQQIMVAANIHRADHKDYYPLAGILTGAQPQDFDDSDTRKYDYRTTTPGSGYGAGATLTRALAPITVALGSEMGFKGMLWDTHDQTVTNTIDQTGLTRCFFCPSHCQTVQDFQALEPGNIAIYFLLAPDNSFTYIDSTVTSYIFNEAVVGFNDQYGRLRGHATMVRQPSLTMFACDGNGTTNSNNRFDSPYPQYGTFTLYNNWPKNGVYLPPAAPALTLAEAFQGDQPAHQQQGKPLCGEPAFFDLKRHQKKINIAFCDGHVELRNIDAIDLKKIYVIAP